MNKSRFSKLAVAISVAIAFTLSCSDNGNSGGGTDDPIKNGSIKKAKISGVFQKGPFIAGTAATLNELDSDLNPTGRPYQTLLTDDRGSFELRNVELVSPYAHLIASGFYRNENTGRQSAAPITLQAIVDVTNKDNINVNILTHLEYYRVIDLVDGGMTVKAAKKQALKEIFAVFGIDSDAFNKDSEDMTIFGTSDADAALLAVSVLLLGDLSEADFSQRLMNLSQAIRTGEDWGNDTKEAIVVEYCEYGPNDCWPMPTNDMCQDGKLVQTCSNPKINNKPTDEKSRIAWWASEADLESIRRNILAWGLSTEVPEFGKYIYGYWVAKFGLGNCSNSNESELKTGTSGIVYICKSSMWAKANRGDIIAYKWKCDESNEGEEKKIDGCLNEDKSPIVYGNCGILTDDGGCMGGKSGEPFYRCENGIWNIDWNYSRGNPTALYNSAYPDYNDCMVEL